MCGRYTLINLARLMELFPWITQPPIEFAPRFNIAPTQPILAVASDHPDQYDHFFWGLVPPWAKDPSVGSKMINARAETLAKKNAFKNAYRRRRCLIPADGFYEWTTGADGKTRQPMYLRMKSGRSFALAGLWESWQDDKGNELRSATIITTPPNKQLAPLHDRMPAILSGKDLQRWLECSDAPDARPVDDLLAPWSGEELEISAVSIKVNAARNEGADLIEPLVPEKTTLFG